MSSVCCMVAPSEYCFFLLFLCLYTGTMPTQLLPHAYAEWEGCLRGSFPRLGAYAGASAGFFVGCPCWMAMFAAMFTVAVLNATLDLAALVLVGVAAFLGSDVVLAPFGSLHVRCERKNESMTIYCWAFGQRASKWSRCLRAASAEPTRWNQDKSTETIYHIHISLYASPAAHTPATIYARICVDKLVDNLHIPSHLKNANEHLPTQLCVRNKNLHCFRGYLHTPPRTVKYQVVSLRNFIRSSLEYITPCIQKKTMLKYCSMKTIYIEPNEGKWLINPLPPPSPPTPPNNWGIGNKVFQLIMKRIFLCNWFFIAKFIGDYVLDFVLVNVLGSRFWIGSLAAFAFFSSSFTSFHFLPFLITFFEKLWKWKELKWIGNE